MTAPSLAKTDLQTKSVLVVDDHPIFRAGLIGLIRRNPEYVVCGEAEDAAQALVGIDQLHPDLVLMDMGLRERDRSGLELLKDVRAMHPHLPVLVISMYEETHFAERVLRAGGRGYIMKQEGPEKILQAIKKVLSGKVYVSENMAAVIVDSLSGTRSKDVGSVVAQLTDREFEIFSLCGHGCDSHDIAEQLNLSLKTVDTHRAHIREKLKLRNNTELIHHATKWIGEQA